METLHLLKFLGRVLQSPGDPSGGGWTQIKKSPEKSGRFNAFSFFRLGQLDQR